MKDLRTVIELNGLAFLSLALLMILYPYPVRIHLFEPVREIPLLRAGGVILGGLGFVLFVVARFPLLGGQRRIALSLSILNLLIAGIAGLPMAKQGHLGGIGLVLFLPLVVAALGWSARQENSAEEIAEGLTIPQEVRRSWLRQIREAAVQEERNRLARDLHDSIKQQLFTINVSTAAAQELWEQNPERAKAALVDVRRSAREAMVEMQTLLHQLQPQALASVGLVEALREQCEALGFRTGAEVVLELGEAIPDDRLTPGVQESLFRIAQEAMSNVSRHARARRVRVYLGREEQSAVLLVADNGQGFNPEEKRSGLGLPSLRERTESFHGKLKIDSAPGAGTAVRVEIPLTLPPAGQSKMVNWQYYRILMLAVFAAFWITRPVFSPSSVGSTVYITIALLANALLWRRRARRSLQNSPGSPLSMKESRYIDHRDSALSFFLAGIWAPWSWRIGEIASGWTITWLAGALLSLTLAVVELVRLHHVSEARSEWWLSLTRPTPAKWIFFMTLLCALAFGVGTLWLGSQYRPEIWTELRLPTFPEAIGLLLGAILLLYLHSRRPSVEKVPA